MTAVASCRCFNPGPRKHGVSLVVYSNYGGFIVRPGGAGNDSAVSLKEK